MTRAAKITALGYNICLYITLTHSLSLTHTHTHTHTQSMTHAAEKAALGQLSQLLPQVVALIQSLLSSAENQEILLFSFNFLF
jgi:hypothetical protein